MRSALNTINASAKPAPFPALASSAGAVLAVCLQGAPNHLIVLETDIRLAEQPFDDSHQLGLGQPILAAGERPHGFRKYDVRDQNGFGSIENSIRTRRLGLIVVQQIAEQDIGVDGDQDFGSSSASCRDSSSSDGGIAGYMAQETLGRASGLPHDGDAAIGNDSCGIRPPARSRLLCTDRWGA